MGMSAPTLSDELEVIDHVADNTDDTERGLVAIETYLSRYTGAALLRAIDEAAPTYVAALAPDNTQQAYGHDWAWWLRFATATDLPPLTVSRGLLVAYVAWLACYRSDDGRRFAISTIERRLTGTISGLRVRLGAEAVPVGIGRDAYVAITRLRKRLASEGVILGRVKAPPMWPEQLARVIECLPPDKLISRRDEAMLRIMFSTAMRTAETSALLAADMAVETRGLLVRIRDSKTGQRTAPLPYELHYPQLCPVRAWTSWRDAARLAADSPAFPRMDRHGNLYPAAISAEAVGDRVTELAKRAGLEVRMTGHSLRRGHASTARRRGRDNTSIERSGGWSTGSRALAVYLEEEDSGRRRPRTA
jgi:integrase